MTRRRTCLCEHASHWAPVDTEHDYQRYSGEDVEDVTTIFGVFPMCKDCRDREHGRPMMGTGAQLPVVSSWAVLPVVLVVEGLSPVANVSIAALVLVVVVAAAVVVLLRDKR